MDLDRASIQPAISRPTNTRRYCIAIAAVAVLLHVLFHILLPMELSSDAASYDQIATNALAGKGMTYFQWGEEAPTIRRGPGYPFVLMMIYGIFGHRYLPVFLLQMIFTFLTARLVFDFCKRRFDPRVALAASLILLFDLRVLSSEHTILTEITYMLGITALCIMLESSHGKSYWYFACAGVLTGFLLLIRTTIILWPAIFGLYWILHRGSRRRLFAQAAVYAIAAVVIVIPWTVRNYVVFDSFIPVTSGTGFALWQGNHPDNRGFFPEDPTEMNELMANGRNELEKDRLLKRAAVEMIKERPGEVLKLWLIKIGRFWSEDFWSRQNRSVFSGLSGPGIFAVHAWKFYEFAVFIFFLIGLVGCFRRIPIISLMMLNFTLVHMITVSLSRYRVALTPLIYPIAAYGLFELIRLLRRRGSSLPDSMRMRRAH